MIYIATDNLNDGFPLSNAYDDTIYQKANAEYYLKFRFPIDRLGVWKHLTCETILKADDARGLQLFKIKKINKLNGYVRVYAKHISDDLNFISVDKIAVSNATGRRVMEALAGSTTEQHNFIFNSDVATMHTLNLSNTTAGKVLSKDKHSIIGQWGGELIRDNFLVDLKARAGVDTEILFMNKKNVKNLDNVVSTENLTTRLKLIVEKEHEGKKQTITATVDSPNINAYPRIYTNYLKVNNNNIETQQQLIEYGVKYFKDSLVDFPTDNLTVNVIDKNQEQINLFDTVWFRNVDFNIDKRLKVVAYEYSPMAKRYKKISFGALKVAGFGQSKALSQLEAKIEEKVEESFVDAFKIQKNLSSLLKEDRKGIEDKLVELEEKSKGALAVKRALFEADGSIPDVVKTKILDAVEADIGRLKTIITEAELIKAIQAKLNYAEIKNALIDKAFINQIISDEKFTQQFEDGQVTTQNIFTKLKDSIKSNISKEFITKEGVKKIVNDLTIDADGIRQITQQESSKVFENKKQELKGINSYLHKKYSDYADGRNMDNNSNRKYIGIYTGEKQQAPTSASEYSWTKIRGEDGERGRDGVDGKSINRNYITDSDKLNNKGFYSWNKWEKSTSGNELVLTKVGGSDTYGFWFNLTDLVKTQFQNETLTWSIEIKASRNMTLRNVGFETNGKKQVNITTTWNRISHTFINKFTNVFAFVFYNPTTDFNNGDKIYIRLPKLEKGDVATEWSPAYEDLRGRDGTDGHSLTASLWFTGGYVNNETNNVKLNLKVFYDGREIRDFRSNIAYKGGGISNWATQSNPTIAIDNTVVNKFWGDGEKDGTTLFALATVNYNGLQTVADARLDNVPNVEDVKETIKKFKTFESTLDDFKSEIGEIKSKEIKTIVNTPNLCTEDFSGDKSKRGNDLYFNVSPSLKANTKYTVIVDVNLVKENVHQKTKVYGAKSGGGEQWLKSGRNVWVVDYATEQTRVNIWPLGEFSKVFNVEIYEGDYRDFIEQNNRFVSMETTKSETTGLYSYKIKHNISNAKGKYFLVKFDLASLPADKWFSSGDSGTLTIYTFGDKQLTEELKLKDNEYILKAHLDDTFYIFHSTNSLNITNVRLYEVRFGVTLAPQSSLIDISSIIDQSKEAVTISARKEIESKLSNYPTNSYLSNNFANKRELENLVSKSELKVLSDRIESSVNTDNFGTTLSQNAYYVRIAWNGISDYVQFENGGLNFYEGSNTQNNLRARIDDGNYTFWRDGYNLGNMGTGYYIKDKNKKGIQFHLEYDGWFMGWSYREKRTDDHYTWKWYYTSGSVDGTYADTLNAGCHTNFRWHEIWYFKTQTSWFKITDGLNGTISVVTNIENIGDGRIRWWTKDLTFKNGILIGG